MVDLHQRPDATEKKLAGYLWIEPWVSCTETYRPFGRDVYMLTNLHVIIIECTRECSFKTVCKYFENYFPRAIPSSA